MLNVVCMEDGHILRRIGDAIINGGTDVTAGHPVADGTNLWLPYYLFTGQDKTKKDVCFFTHKDTAVSAKATMFEVAAVRADVCIAMSEATASRLPGHKTWVIEPPADPQFSDFTQTYDGGTLHIGVPSVPQPDDRKGLELVEKLNEIPGVTIHVSGGGVHWSAMPDWYSRMDYILVLGRIEGGPMAVKEAISMRKPVIAPDVGWCWEHPVIRYHNDNDLVRVLTALAPKDPVMAWKQFVSHVLAACA